MNIDLIQDAFDNKYPVHLGSLGDYPDTDIEAIFDGMYTNDQSDIHYRSGLGMYELRRLQNYTWTPTVLTDSYNKIMQLPFMEGGEIIGFLSEKAQTGYGWHDDLYDLFAVNVIGETTWTFEDQQIRMKPNDIMFVPAGVFHGVVGADLRFTASIVSPQR